MRQTITLECAKCGKAFSKLLAEHTRRIKKGATRFFCGVSCSASAGNFDRPKTGRKRLSWKERIDKYGSKIRTSSVVNRIKQRAKKKGVPCNITNDLFWEMLESQEWKCAYSGEKMVINGKCVQNQVTVDRVKPSLGYVKGNMVLCCRWANLAKGSGTREDLIERAKKLVEFGIDPAASIRDYHGFRKEK
jgi:hypothetical protein